MAAIATLTAALSGSVGRIIYSGDTFCVFTLGDYVVAGLADKLVPGETLEVWGEWVEHPKYGRQVKMTRYERPVTGSADIAAAYLGSGLIKGIGPVLAQRIVSCLGADAVNKIIADPSVLAKVKGISAKKAGEMAGNITETLSYQRLVSLLMPHGGTPLMAIKAVKEWGGAAMSRISENPYVLTDLPRVGFGVADKIALSMGHATDSPFRLRAGLLFILGEDRNGHCIFPREDALKQASKALGIDASAIEAEIPALVAKKLLRNHGGFLQLERLAVAEESVSASVRHYLRKTGKPYDLTVLETVKSFFGENLASEVPRALQRYETKCRAILTVKQKEAVAKVFEHRLFILTGGPGTGKTTTMKAVVDVAADIRPSWSIALCAPTGRASRRLAEVTGREAVTIHRLLGLHGDETEPQIVNADLVIIDEFSMVDILLAAKLFSSLKPGCHVLLVGDSDQLPSVGPGSVLRDLLECVPSLHLFEILRQARDSQVIVNAHAINTGINEMETGKDFHFYPEAEPEAIRDRILSLVRSYLKKHGTVESLQIISPMKKGPVGVTALNLAIREIVNPPGPPEIKSHTVFRLGDRVIQLENDYNKNVFNGDIGKVVAVKEDGLMVNFPLAGDVEFAVTETETLMLAYAITVHKSQGSEYPVVIMPVTTQHYIMLARNLLYTAVTRTQEHMVLVGEKKAYNMAVRENKVARRYTRLVDLINNGQQTAMAVNKAVKRA